MVKKTANAWTQAGSGYTVGGARFGHADLANAAAVANPSGLLGWGWGNVSLGFVAEGTAGDINDAADVTPTHFSGPASIAVISSNRSIGDDQSAKMAEKFLGYSPTILWCKFYFRTNGDTAGDKRIGLGKSTNEVACFSNGAGFFGIVGFDNEQTSIPIDSNWHLGLVEVDQINETRWYLDGDLVGSMINETDNFPCQFTIKGDSSLGQFDCAWVVWGWR